MKIANIDIQKCIEDAITKELDSKEISVDDQIILCGSDKLQKVEDTENHDEYYIWVSLEGRGEHAARFDNPISAIAERIVDGESIVSFDSLLEFCKWYVEEVGGE